MDTQLVRRPDGPQAWEDHRAIIIDLYTKRGLELEEVMEIMEKEHFFKATKKQYKSRFTEWGIRKNVKSNEWGAILRKKRKREQEGKESAFRLGGTPVDSSRIAREEKRRKPGDRSKLAEAVTPPDLICSTPSPVAYIPVARSPIFSPLQLSKPSRIAILLSLERTFDALRPIALILDRWPNSALAYKIAIESFLRIFIWMVHPLLEEERGILTYAIQTTISMSNGCFLCWAKLVLEMLEASRAKNKPSKRDNGNRFYKCIAKLAINHLAKGPHGKLCGLGSSFVVTMDSSEQLLRTIETHAISGQTLRITWMLCTCKSLIHNPMDSNHYAAVSTLRRAWMLYTYDSLIHKHMDSNCCAAVSTLRIACMLCIYGFLIHYSNQYGAVSALRTAWMLYTYESLIHKRIDSNQYGAVSALGTACMLYTYGFLIHKPVDSNQYRAVSTSRIACMLCLYEFLLEGPLPSRTWVEDLMDFIFGLHPMQMEMWRTVNLIMELVEQIRMDANKGIGSPAPPSPGSDRSQISFLSDSVTDWKERVRGISPYDSTQGNAEAWIDKLEALELEGDCDMRGFEC